MRLALWAMALAAAVLPLSSCDTVEDIIDPRPDLEIAIGASRLEVTDDWGVLAVSDDKAVFYTIIASNKGPGAAEGVSVSIPVPDVIGFPFNAPPGTHCGGDAGCRDFETIEWPIGTLAAGQSRTLSVKIPIARGTSGQSFGLTASVDSPTANSASATVQTRIEATRPVDLSLTTSSASVRPDESLQFDVAYILNNSPLPGATVRMPVPNGASFVSANGGGALSGSEVVWSLGTLPAQSAGRVYATFQISSNREPGHSITATARLTGGAGVSASSRVIAVVAPSSYLRTTVQGTPEFVRAGNEVVYRIEVTNAGTGTAREVLVSIPVPEVTSYPFNAPPGTHCRGNVGCRYFDTIEWPIGTLAAGQRRILTVSVPLDDGAFGGGLFGYLSTLVVSADAPDISAGLATLSTPVLD